MANVSDLGAQGSTFKPFVGTKRCFPPIICALIQKLIADSTRTGESILFLYSWLASWIAEVSVLHVGIRRFFIGRGKPLRHVTLQSV